MLAWALLPLFVAACGSGKSSSGPAAAQKTFYDHFAVDVGGHPASLQVAVLQAELERGLMQRPDLGADEGMFFVYPEPQAQSFWMRNTPEPLDLGYLTRDGRIAETYDLLPLDERPVTSHSGDIQFVLEMPKGWFAAHGVRPGTKVDLAAVAGALRARGFDPVKLGVEKRQAAP